jgi:UDP-N-acetylglucosamine transferase subunit ALG13
VILLTLGTHPQPFERAVDWALDLGEELVVQHGSTPPRPDAPNTAWHEFLDHDVLGGLMADADLVICHAGVGTVMSALRLGRTPVVMPRLVEHGEHVDNHQLQITRALASRNYVIPCTEREELEAAMAIARTNAMRRTEGGELLPHVVRAAGGDPERLLRSRQMADSADSADLRRSASSPSDLIALAGEPAISQPSG